MGKRLAVVLRGPMGVGKSTLRKSFRQKFCSFTDVDFDERYNRTSNRYGDLCGLPHELLFIEICCGEPHDLSFPGPSRDAETWTTLLKNDGREILFFRLWIDWETSMEKIQERIRKSGKKESLLWARVIHCAYQNNLDIVSLPPTLAHQEINIDTTGKDLKAVEDIIESRIRKAHRQQGTDDGESRTRSSARSG